jgi:hypothetical protein
MKHLDLLKKPAHVVPERQQDALGRSLGYRFYQLLSRQSEFRARFIEFVFDLSACLLGLSYRAVHFLLPTHTLLGE